MTTLSLAPSGVSSDIVIFQNFSRKSTRPEGSIDGIRDKEKKLYEKILKYADTTVPGWSKRKILKVPLGLPTISANRFPEFEKIVSNLKDGFDYGVWGPPVVVAIPGKLVRDASTDPAFVAKWRIRESGFFYLSKKEGDPKIEWYLQVCDGRHRQTIEAARQDLPSFDTYDELVKYFWDCQVTFWEGANDVSKAMPKAQELYKKLNKTKINKITAADCLGADVLSEDPEALDYISRLSKLGIYVEGGQAYYGDINGIRTKYGVIKNRGLDNQMLTSHPQGKDYLLGEAVRIIRMGKRFLPNLPAETIPEVNATLIVGLALALKVCKQITVNGCKAEFESWFAEKLTSGTDAPAKKWNELGGNQDNKNAESTALGILLDFKAHAKFLADNKLPGSSYYGALVIEDWQEKLFPKK